MQSGSLDYKSSQKSAPENVCVMKLVVFHVVIVVHHFSAPITCIRKKQCTRKRLRKTTLRSMQPPTHEREAPVANVHPRSMPFKTQFSLLASIRLRRNKNEETFIENNFSSLLFVHHYLYIIDYLKKKHLWLYLILLILSYLYERWIRTYSLVVFE